LEPVAKSANDGKSNKENKKGASDFLADHGGKVAIVAFSIAIGLFYSYYQSGEDRSNQEKQILKEASIEPYEIQELRSCSELDVPRYNAVVSWLLPRDGGVSSSTPVSYGDFIEGVRAQLAAPLHGGHLFDRVVARYAASRGLSVGEGPSLRGAELPRGLLLALLGLWLGSGCTPEDRLGALFRIAATSSNDSEVPQEAPLEAMVELLQHLVDSDQVPPESQVAEAGPRYPVKTHRRKTPREMIDSYYAALAKKDAKPLQPEAIGEEEFVSIMVSRQVCIWAECYRDRR